MSSQDKKLYFPNLNGLRFLAAFSVMVYHFFGAKVLYGHYGVVLFFVLSGFLITFLLLEEVDRASSISIRKFYARRILRIWPLYFFILLLTTLFLYSTSNLDDSYTQALPYYLFFVPNLGLVMDYKIMYAVILWSVGAEEQFYLLWPWIISKINLKNLLAVFLTIIMFWSFGPYCIDYINHNYLSDLEPIRVSAIFLGRMGFGAMATGAIVAWTSRYYPKKLQYIFHPLFQISVLMVTFTLWIGDLLPHKPIIDQIYSILFAIIIANLALNPNVIFSLENKILNSLGKISFGLYVYHTLIFKITDGLVQEIGFECSKLMLFIYSVVLTITVSYLSFNYLESPFLKLKSNKFTVIH